MSSSRAPARRHIRLKEWRPLLDSVLDPTPEYRAATDGSLTDSGFRLRTDVDGFIVAPELPGAAPPERDVLFFGDSFVESTYIAEPERFPAGVQARLASAGHHVRCLNAGYSGATTLHLLLALLAKRGNHRNAGVVLVAPSNDALALVKAGGFWTQTDQRYAPVIPIPEGLETPAQALDADELDRLLRVFVDTCRGLGHALLLATFPHRSVEYGSDPWLRRRFKTAANYGRIVGWRRIVNDVTRRVAAERGVALLDLDAALSAQTRWFYDDLHMNPDGSRQVADLVAERLRALWFAHAGGAGVTA